MIPTRRARLLVVLVGALLATACSGDEGSEDATPAPTAQATDGTSGSEPASTPPVEEEAASDDVEATDEEAAPDGGGNGVIVEDLCAGDQLLRGAITLEDLVDIGILTSTDAVVQSNDARQASTYETFGFICSIVETVDDGETALTIGVSEGSSYWDIAVDQGNAAEETMGAWDVILSSNWLGPLTMRTTDDAGNQDSLFAMWTPADGSIPDAATLERLMRPLAEAIAARSTVDIPRA